MPRIMYGIVEAQCHTFLTIDRKPNAPPPPHTHTLGPGEESSANVISQSNYFGMTFESLPIWKKERGKEKKDVKKKGNKSITRAK